METNGSLPPTPTNNVDVQEISLSANRPVSTGTNSRKTKRNYTASFFLNLLFLIFNSHCILRRGHEESQGSELTENDHPKILFFFFILIPIRVYVLHLRNVLISRLHVNFKKIHQNLRSTSFLFE